MTGITRKAPSGGSTPSVLISAKRLCDIILSSIGLLGLFPIMTVIALLLCGLGFYCPIFTQKRVGQNGVTFTIIKFRTLAKDEAPSSNVTATPLRSRVARFLRSSGLDELPQLINVLRGDMSLVGPRPHSISDHKRFVAWHPDYSDRLTVKPGMTGWAQVCGWRGPVCDSNHLNARIAHDLAYIARQGMAFDAEILIRTVFLPFKSHTTCKPHKLVCLRCHRRIV